MWLFRFRNYVRLERGLHLRCRQPLYRYASYVGLDVVPVAVPIARPCTGHAVSGISPTDIPPMRDIHAGVRRFACSGVRWTRFFAGCGQRLGWAWACNHRELPRAFGDRRAVDREGSGDRDRPPSETIVGVASAGHADGSRFPAKGRPALSSLKFDGSWSRREGWAGNRVMPNVPTGRRPCHQSDRTNSPSGSGRR